MWELTLSPYDPWLNSRRGHAQGRVKSWRVSETKSNRSICCDDALGYKGTAESSFTCNSHCSWLLVQKYFSWIQQVLVPCLISVLDVSLLVLPTSTSYGKCYVKWSLRESTSQVKTVLTWASVQSSYILNVINSCGVEFYSYLNWGSFKPLQPAITIPSSGPGTAVWCLFFSLFFLCHSFSTAYQCIYYSPEHTAKAQEVLNIMSLLQPLITRLVDQLLQAAHEHSSPGLRDALKHLSDKVRQHLSLSFAFTSISPISLFLFTSSCCSTQSIGMSCQMIFTSETRALYINL